MENLNNAHPAGDTGVPSESFDLAEENWHWPEADFAERERIFQRYWAHSEGYLWFLQNDPEVPQSIRDEARQFGFPKDEFTDNRRRPHYIYVREGRRIWGEYDFTERDAALDNTTGLPRRKPDGIALAEFGFQLDVFWVTWGGANAADVISKHKQRICSLHLKDLARDAKSDLANPKSARALMVRLSAGRVDIPAVMAAAKASGVSHFIIEDESPNAGSQLPESLHALKTQF